MKKVIVSLLLLCTATISAEAASKNKRQRGFDNGVKIDRSHDHAYSANWAHQAQSPAPDANFKVGSGVAYRPFFNNKTLYYGLSNFTLHGAIPVNMNAPYEGDYAASYDGPAKNAYRNIRANNDSEILPSSTGR